MILSFLFYIGLFLGLCVFIVLAIAFVNIFTKSYKPNNALIVIVGLLLLFGINGYLALDNLSQVLRQMQSNMETDPTLTSPTPRNPGGNNSGGNFF